MATRRTRSRRTPRKARVTFTTDRRTLASLEKLSSTGFYGKSRGEVAEYLLKAMLKELRAVFRKLPR